MVISHVYWYNDNREVVKYRLFIVLWCDMKLNFKNKKSKYLKIGSLIVIFVTIISIMFSTYFKFIFKDYVDKVKNDNIQEEYIAYYVDGEETNAMPSKGNYDVTVTCDKGATGTWNYDSWSIIIANATQTGTRCSVSFVTGDNSGASQPELYSGLIPIVYDNNDNIVVANVNSSWYNYDNFKWANAILIDQSNSAIKNKYLNSDGTYKSGTQVDMSDVLQMYVWVPRYKYQLFNVSGNSTSAQMINVEFESADTPKSTGTQNSQWLTHPAFTFGSTELNGIWVGKFESSNTTSDVKIIPNVSSLRDLSVANMFNASRSIESNTKYGLVSSEVDTHMMKNMEWGAVAYLSQSKYGKYGNPNYTEDNKEIYVNNSEEFITGSSGGSPSARSGEASYSYNVSTEVVYTKDGENSNSASVSVVNDTNYPWTLSNGTYKTSTQGIASSTTSLTYNFTLPKTGEVSFDWSVSSETISYDYIYYTIIKDGETLTNTGISTRIGGTSYGSDESSLTYSNVVEVLEPGTYSIVFTYVKDGSGDGGTDTGYIKNLNVSYGANYTKGIAYTEVNGIGASTTGTIYGIYDMSGGGYEYVMGNMVDSNGAFYPEQSGMTAPASKYYDSYLYGDDTEDYSRGHLGDATKEVNSWNSDEAEFVRRIYMDMGSIVMDLNSPWFTRGGYDFGNTSSGIFAFAASTGEGTTSHAWRVVLTSE